MDSFSLDDYDCIGFDLDCTIAEYNVKALMKLIYDLLADFLVREKYYDDDFLQRPFEEGEYFLQKGLFVDMKKGNILKIAHDGTIITATHGTKCLNDDNISEIYGPEKTFNVITEFINNPLSIINTPHEKLLRSCLDVFDTPCVVLFARIVDYLDKKNGGVAKEYDIWPDILKGLYYLYRRNHFESGESHFFSELKKNPELYYKKWSKEKLAWLREIKSKKFVYLLTGSFIDFATLTSTFCLGEDWKDYFDVIICFARKPFFFTANHEFLKIEGGKEGDAVDPSNLKVNGIYSKGNWAGLRCLIAKQTQKEHPKCLYIGDNLIQDVYAPVQPKCCDSVAVSVELKSLYNSSKIWGCYFKGNRKTTYWNKLIQTHAKICVSSLDIFLSKPLNFSYNCLKLNADEISETNGYYCM